MKKLLPIFTALGVTGSLASGIYLGQINEFSFPQVIVKFCPQTANKNLPNGKKAQATLDLKYCRYRRRLLKEVWQREQFKSIIPLPEGSFSIQEFKGDDSGSIWLLLAPVLAGSAYLSWANKCQADYDSKFEQLEDLKSYFKLTTVSARNEREFKSTTINQSWDKQRVKAGQISIEAVQDRLTKQAEIQDRSHISTVKQFDLNDSQIDKNIAENQLAVAEASKKLEKLNKIVETKVTDQLPANEQLKNSLIDALKNHEDGWLWYLVESFTSIIIHGKAGSYKSYTAAAIALLKHYLINAKVESICDIDFDQNKNDSWKFLVPLEPSIYGQGIDWESYDEGFIAAIDRSKVRTLKDKPIVSIWDELTNAKGKFDNAQNVVPFVIATPRKRNEHCILISHNLTQDCLGGCTGMSEPIKTQTYRLNLKTTPQGKPLFKGVLEGLVDND
ncbi:MAG: hypothetical protein ACYTXE_35120, partial [Nostoc sp.]